MQKTLSIVKKGLMLLNDELQLFGLDGLRKTVLDADILQLLVSAESVVACNGHNDDFLELGSLLLESSLLSKDALSRLAAIHDRHADVRQNHAVTNVTTRLRHVQEITVEKLLAVVHLVAFQPVGVVEHVLDSGHVEH